MKIRRVLARGFGGLRGEFHFSADRVNLVVEPNERGKSSLADAILAGLYGFPAGQRRSAATPLTEADAHRPWDGGDYVVELDVEVGGEAWTIRRDFGRREERVFEFRTGRDATARFQTSKDNLDVGLRVSGLERDDFARTVLLRQNEIRAVRESGGVTAALQRIATSQSGDVAASEAVETLRQALRQYRGRKIRRGKIENEIAGIDEEIAALSRSLEEMAERRRRAEERILELERTAREEGLVDERLQRLEYLIVAAGRREDAERLERETRERRELDEREAEFQALAPYAALPQDGARRMHEINTRIEALAADVTRLTERLATEGADAAAEAVDRDGAGLAALGPQDLARLTQSATDLAAAYRERRDARRALRAATRRLRRRGGDPSRLESLAARIGALGPEDRRFLLDCGEREQAARAALLDAERERDRLDAAIAAASAPGPGGRAASAVLGAIAAISGVAAALLWVLGRPLGWTIAAAAVAMVAALARLALAAPPAREGAPAPAPAAAEGEAARLRAERDAVEERRRECDARVAAVRARLENVAAASGFDSGEEVLAAFRETGALGEEAAALPGLRRRAESAEGAARASASSVSAIFEAVGHRPRFGAATPRTAAAFRAAVAASRERRIRLDERRERRAALMAELSAREEERAALVRSASEILTAAGLPPTEDLAAAAAALEEGLLKRERCETLRREIIPALVRRAISHKGESLRRSVEAADGVLRRRALEHPTLAGLEPERSLQEYVEERDRLRQDARSLGERRLEMSAELSDVLREYRRDTPDTLRWLREWREQRDRAASFLASVGLACDVLEEISREAYAEWADVLNERASEFLAAVAPGWSDLRFAEDLSVSVREGAGGTRRSRDEIDVQLSAGTGDQIYFSARLAMTEYLSSAGVRLPLILDDPFVSFDDDRFSRTMALLLDKVSRRHQVILMTCHAARHHWWQERNPERFAERVRVMSLQPSAV